MPFCSPVIPVCTTLHSRSSKLDFLDFWTWIAVQFLIFKHKLANYFWTSPIFKPRRFVMNSHLGLRVCVTAGQTRGCFRPAVTRSLDHVCARMFPRWLMALSRIGRSEGAQDL